MKIFFGSDHNGFEVETELTEWLQKNGMEVVSFSNKIHTPDDDYPDFALPVAKAVSSDPEARGIVICGSGGGVSIVANKVKNARCVLVMSEDQAISARNDDNANIIALSAHHTTIGDMKKILIHFLETNFELGGRHERRYHKIEMIEAQEFK